MPLVIMRRQAGRDGLRLRESSYRCGCGIPCADPFNMSACWQSCRLPCATLSLPSSSTASRMLSSPIRRGMPSTIAPAFPSSGAASTWHSWWGVSADPWNAWRARLSCVPGMWRSSIPCCSCSWAAPRFSRLCCLATCWKARWE